jgi:hypothetical protein
MDDYRRTPPLLAGRGRLIPTHETHRPEFKQAIYLARDARDVVLSEYAYMKALKLFTGDLDAFIHAFLRGRVNGVGSWQDHVQSWLGAAVAGKVRLLLVRYEDLRLNPENTLTGIMEFCGFDVTRDAISAAVENNSFEKMREKEDAARNSRSKGSLRQVAGNSPGNRFVRSGKVGAWREQLSASQVRWIEGYTGNALTRLGYVVTAHDNSVSGGLDP